MVKQWAGEIQSNAPHGNRVAASKSILEVDANYALADCEIGRSSYEGAIAPPREVSYYLRQAIDHDVCPLRTTTVIGNTIRSSGGEGVWLVDVPAIVDRRDGEGRAIPDDILDPRWFVDHVRPTIEGHQEIATAIYETLPQQGWIRDSSNAECVYTKK